MTKKDMNYSFKRATEAIDKIRLHKFRGKPRPHKLILLKTVFQLINERIIQSNKIYYNDELRTTFASNFKIIEKDFWCQPQLPFFHLRKDGFWLHKIRLGMEITYSEMITPGGSSELILRTIEYAYFVDWFADITFNLETVGNLIEFVDCKIEKILQTKIIREG